MANPYFNAKFYAASNPDLAKAGLVTPEDLWSHYVLYGAGEAVNGVGLPMRAPAPWYDAEYYFQANPDLQAANLTPAQLFEHFVTYGIAEGRAPREGFGLNDTQLLAYANANKDLRDAFGIDNNATSLTAPQKASLASHFFAYGYQEDRPGAPYNAMVGNTYTLTTDTQEITGTNLDDTFNATAAGSLLDTDVLDGRFGNDTLNIAAGAYAANAKPTLKGIETINNAETNALDLVNATGVQTINSTGTSAEYLNASASTTFKTTGNLALSSFKDAAVSNLKVGTTAGATAVVVTSGEATKVKGVSLDLANTADASVTITGLTAVETVTVTGSSTALNTVVAAQTGIKTFDASAAKGGVIWASGALANDATVKGGAGADQLTVEVVAGKNLVLDAGAGTDTIIITSAAGTKTTITGGAGNDTINLGASNGADTVVYTQRADSIYTQVDTITGFATGTDKLDLKALGLQGDKAVIAAQNVSSVTNYAGFAGGDITDMFVIGGVKSAAAVWTDGTDSVFFADVNGDGHFNADQDLVIKLNGITSVATADVIFA